MMKFSDLCSAVDHYRKGNRYDDPSDDLKVVVQTQNGGVPHRYLAPVKTVIRGFDWTRPYFIVHTADPLVAYRQIEKPVDVTARERLEFMKDHYSKLGFTYIPRAREQAWIDGFVEGLRYFRYAVDAKGQP